MWTWMTTKYRAGEEGVALITAAIILMIVATISVTVVGLSIHNSDQSEFDRGRTQAIAAAEAGLDAYLQVAASQSGQSACQGTWQNQDLPTKPLTHYDVTVSLYSSYPPNDGSLIACGSGLPLAAMVQSTGTSVAGGPRPVTRTMEALVKLAPTYGGLTYEIFSDTGLNIQNKLIDNGNNGNNGDIYTNGNFTMQNNTVIGGSVFAQGTITINQGIVKADVYGKGAVSLTALSVFGKVTASDATSTMALNNGTHLYGAARAGSTIFKSGNSSVDGGMVANSPSGPPPQRSFPILLWNPNDWPGYTINTFNACNPAQNFINNMPAGNQVVRIQAVCNLNWGGNSQINVNGNLAIITDGSITTTNNVAFNGVGGRWTVFLIRPYTVGLVCGVTPGPYDISLSNSTGFNNLVLGAYSQCTIQLREQQHGRRVGTAGRWNREPDEPDDPELQSRHLPERPAGGVAAADRVHPGDRQVRSGIIALASDRPVAVIAFAAFGLVFGSFLTVVVHRLPRGESVVAPRSACPTCGAQIRARDNVPVLSYLALHGKCKGCSTHISAEYPITEAITAALFVGAALAFSDVAVAALIALFLGVMLAAALIDARHRIIPNRLTYPALVVGAAALLVLAMTGRPVSVAGAGLGFLAFGGGLLLIAMIAPGGMGMGDVKLAALIGLILGSLGLRYVGVAAGLAVLAGGVGALVALALGRSRRSAIPFGPYLAGGASAAALFGAPIATWYLSLH